MDDPLIASELRALKDIVEPAPVSYVPQTWGWAVLALLLLVVLIILGWRQYQHWRANRYRRAAMVEIGELERQLRSGPIDFPFEDAVAALIKRTALVVWPRSTVASLTGEAWVRFLAEHGPANGLDQSLALFLKEQEYRAAMDRRSDPAKLLQAARAWIEGHHV